MTRGQAWRGGSSIPVEYDESDSDDISIKHDADSKVMYDRVNKVLCIQWGKKNSVNFVSILRVSGLGKTFLQKGSDMLELDYEEAVILYHLF